jgi:exopolysaccharide production protein ExoQ
MTGAKWAVEGRTGAPRVMLGQSSMPTVRPSTGSARAWLAYPILVALFAFMGPYSLHPAAATGDDAAVGASAAAAASGVEEGTHTRQAAVVVLAAFAALTLSATRRRRRLAASEPYDPANPTSGPYQAITIGNAGPLSSATARLFRSSARTVVAPGSLMLVMLLTAYVGLASISVTWADDSVLAAKRAIVFLVLAFTGYALAQAWSLRDVVFFSIFANAASLILGIGGALARGDFQPFALDYRFVGFGNPNLHGIEAACLVIAAAVALCITRDRRLLLVGLLVFGVGMLLLTKSRTALVAVLLAGAVAGTFVVRRNRLALLVVAAAVLVFAVVVFVPQTVTRAQNAALLGRSAESDNPATLSGRTLLWEDLLDFASARPWLGYGFDSFWTPAHIAEVSVRRGWVITQSHSGYIEALLNVGWVGGSLLVLVLAGGVVTAIRRYRRVQTPLAMFAVAMLVWYMTNMLAEAIPEAHFSTLLVMIILAHLALRSAAPDDRLPERANVA